MTNLEGLKGIHKCDYSLDKISTVVDYVWETGLLCCGITFGKHDWCVVGLHLGNTTVVLWDYIWGTGLLCCGITLGEQDC